MPRPILCLYVLLFFVWELFSAQGKIESDLTLSSHPRLWVEKEALVDLKKTLHSSLLKEKAEQVIVDAEWCVSANLIGENEAHTYQMGTRAIASRLKNLTLAWALTGDQRFRDGAMRNLKNMVNWNQISCEARKGMSHEPLMYFCLSAGEHSADIALMYDMFRPQITPEEKKVFDEVLDRFYWKAAVRAMEKPPWWSNKEWSNWNGVCAGGIGLLALAFYDDRPEARDLLDFVEESLSYYFESYVTNGGGNHEGTGYWNYGMHYAIRYLLSWENATGKKHPAFEIPEISKSLDFPVDFTKISFGDNDGWHPSGFFFMMANRTGNFETAKRAAAHIYKSQSIGVKTYNKFSRCSAPDYLYAAKYIPSQSSMEALFETRLEKKVPLARVYDGLGWAILADDSVYPKIRLAVRGGSNEVRGHGHIDVMSFKCSIGEQRMIEDQKGGGYTPVTFSHRGHHVYSRSAVAKSALFIHGLSPLEGERTKRTAILEGDDWKGVLLDGTGLYLPRWRRSFIGRLFLMIEGSYFIIVDTSLAGGGVNRGMESRFHTYGQLKTDKSSAEIRRGNEILQMSFGSLGRGRLAKSFGTPEHTGKATKILRWLGNSDYQVTVLKPGEQKLSVDLKRSKRGMRIDISGNGIKREIEVSRTLEVLRCEESRAETLKQ